MQIFVFLKKEKKNRKEEGNFKLPPSRLNAVSVYAEYFVCHGHNDDGNKNFKNL